MCSRPVPSLLLDAAVQTLLYSVASHDASTQLPLTEFFIGCTFSTDPLDRQALPSAHCDAGSASPPQPADIATLCSPSSASHASDGHQDTTASRVPLVSRSFPVSAPHMVCLLKQPRCDLFCVHPSQSRPHSHMSVPPKWEHILCAQLLPTREVQVPPFRETTILLVQSLVQELVLFLNLGPCFFPWSNLGNPNLTGSDTLILLMVTSCIINTVSLSFSGIQARRVGTPPISLRRPVEGSMRSLSKKPVIMFRTSPISFLRILVTRTLLSCSTRTPLSLTLWCLPSQKTPQAKVLGAWFSSSFEHCCSAPHMPGHQRSHFAQYTFTMSLPRYVTHPLSCFSGFTST